MNRKKYLFIMSFIMVILLSSVWFIKGFYLCWTEITPKQATVTINFLFPMQQECLTDHLTIHTEIPYKGEITYKAKWLNQYVVALQFQEKDGIRGKKVNVIIEDAPSTIKGISKSVSIPVQFETDVEIIEPKQNILIATDQSFLIRFNTPMNKHTLHQYIECEVPFYIKPLPMKTPENKSLQDTTTFQLTPKQSLENNKKYVLSFRKGMAAESGMLLEENHSIILQTDKKPIIISSYPQPNSKWIGLYPRMILEMQTPIQKASVSIENEKIEGIMRDPYHAEFILPKVLKPNTMYEASFEGQAASGEKSDPYIVRFHTVGLEEDRIWLKVIEDNPGRLYIYKGEKKIKSFDCISGDRVMPLRLGTYYIQAKGEYYTKPEKKEGANYWLKLYENCYMQGKMRDVYWQIKPEVSKNKGDSYTSGNVIFSDDDARWLYENIPENTMVILCKTRR